MFVWNDKAWNQSEAAAHSDVTLADLGHGLFAGTRVATAIGWRKVEAISEGDQVLTFDGGLQTVVAVKRVVVFAGEEQASLSDWPLRVPAGALGNREEMLLPPRQAVLVESDAAEEIFGDPFALIPASSLEGFRGISLSRPSLRVEVISLQFEQDEIVFANTGALFYCPKDNDILAGGYTAQDDYTVLSMEEADLLVCCLEMEETQGQKAAVQAA